MSFNFLPRGLKGPFGWYRGKHLPHFDAGERAQFITMRLYDSMPQAVLDESRTEARTDAAFRRRVEKYLDAGHGKCWLRQAKIAAVVQEALIFYHDKKYLLHAWVIMPNHVHFLISPSEGIHLDKILQSLKSYTAHGANKLLGRTGQFWQHESFDRYIRGPRHFRATIRYIHMNPVEARLCKEPEDWPYSSASYLQV